DRRPTAPPANFGGSNVPELRQRFEEGTAAVAEWDARHRQRQAPQAPRGPAADTRRTDRRTDHHGAQPRGRSRSPSEQRTSTRSRSPPPARHHRSPSPASERRHGSGGVRTADPAGSLAAPPAVLPAAPPALLPAAPAPHPAAGFPPSAGMYAAPGYGGYGYGSAYPYGTGQSAAPPIPPSPYAPQQPSPYAPQQPSPYAPQQPSPYAPQQPSLYAPQQPSPYAPQQPFPPSPYAPQQPQQHLPPNPYASPGVHQPQVPWPAAPPGTSIHPPPHASVPSPYTAPPTSSASTLNVDDRMRIRKDPRFNRGKTDEENLEYMLNQDYEIGQEEAKRKIAEDKQVKKEKREEKEKKEREEKAERKKREKQEKQEKKEKKEREERAEKKEKDERRRREKREREKREREEKAEKEEKEKKETAEKEEMERVKKAEEDADMGRAPIEATPAERMQIIESIRNEARRTFNEHEGRYQGRIRALDQRLDPATSHLYDLYSQPRPICELERRMLTESVARARSAVDDIERLVAQVWQMINNGLIAGTVENFREHFIAAANEIWTSFQAFQSGQDEEYERQVNLLQAQSIIDAAYRSPASGFTQMEVEEAPAQLMLEGQQAQQHGPLSFRGVPQQRWPDHPPSQQQQGFTQPPGAAYHAPTINVFTNQFPLQPDLSPWPRQYAPQPPAPPAPVRGLITDEDDESNDGAMTWRSDR
ncbi:MAG: hypothetical protein Q9196_006884, partial [Gyalolechia fulgens]